MKPATFAVKENAFFGGSFTDRTLQRNMNFR
jgi:hypothetical protein